MFDFALLLIVALVTYCVASEGAWGAALIFLSVVFSGLLAMNWFEPLADALEGTLGTGAWPFRWDVVALLGLFAALVFGFRAATEYMMPTYVEVHSLVYDVLRWSLGLATGYVVMAVLLTSLHTAPLPREFLGFRPERANLFEMAAPDRQWLGFTQYVSEHSLGRGNVFDGVAYERIPGRESTRQVWSSFPIRYAMRREMFMTGSSGGGSGAAPPGSAPPPQTVPSGPSRPAF